jgi:hypothetical protein
MFDRPANEIGYGLADHDENDVKHDQSHSDMPRSISCAAPRNGLGLNIGFPSCQHGQGVSP